MTLSMISSKKDATFSFITIKKIENRERKIVNKYYHANTLNANIEIIRVFCKRTENVSSVRK